MTGGSWKNCAVEWPYMVAGLLEPADPERLRRGRLAANSQEPPGTSEVAAVEAARALRAAQNEAASPGSVAGPEIGVSTGAAGPAISSDEATGAPMDAANDEGPPAIQTFALPIPGAVMAPHPPADAAVGGTATPGVLTRAAVNDDFPVFNAGIDDDAASSSSGSSSGALASGCVLQKGPGTDLNELFGDLTIQDAVTDVLCEAAFINGPLPGDKNEDALATRRGTRCPWRTTRATWVNACKSCMDPSTR